ncbi:MAG: hypothetical protein IKH38_01480 [Clostridia bacterium]|nr:hypothetical protein [Clostridia bacterium]
MSEDLQIRTDRMRYTKNKVSARLALLAIVFNVVFFISLYKSNVGTYYYNVLMGASIVYNLVFMLAAFLGSESVKNYRRGYSWLLVALGVGQLIRIFIYPMNAHQAVVSGAPVMGDGQFLLSVICLVGSALCLFAAAAVNLQKSRALARHIASLETGKA